MAQSRIFNIQKLTKLPLSVIEVGGSIFPDMLVQTPMGKKIVALKEEHRPFIFGSTTQTDIHAKEVIDQITKLEEESKDFLLDKWLKSNA